MLEVADILGAGVAKALLGKAAVPDEYPFVTGSIGLLGTKPSWELMNECDTLLMVGSELSVQRIPPEGGHSARRADRHRRPRCSSLRYPMDVNLVGDSRETLRALLPLLRRKNERSWRERIEEDVAEWWELVEARAMTEANPINPQRVFWELSSRLPDDCILSCDSGTAAGWYARDLKIRRGMMASLSGGLATMGPAVPYAIAAKFAIPSAWRSRWSGDGAMQMNGINGLITIAKYWREWSDPRLVVLVLNNRDLNMVTWEQRAMAAIRSSPRRRTCRTSAMPSTRESLGSRGRPRRAPRRYRRRLGRALSADRPVVLEAVTRSRTFRRCRRTSHSSRLDRSSRRR